MFKPIIIKSSLEFVIVGPLDANNVGIIVKSDSVDIDIIGFANLVYSNFDYDAFNRPMSDRIVCVSSRTFNFLKRKSVYLLCYREDIKLSNVKPSALVEKNLNKFIENIEPELWHINQLYNQESVNRRVKEAVITWHISPLILACMGRLK